MLPSALLELGQRWLMGSTLCQVHISLDVTLCTVSILHLGTISYDRYTAIVSRPLQYKVRPPSSQCVANSVKSEDTRSRSLCLVFGCWLVGLMVGFVCVMSGLYSTEEHLAWARTHPDTCVFHVNKTFAVLGPTISFLLPTAVMIFSYIKSAFLSIEFYYIAIFKGLPRSKKTRETTFSHGVFLELVQ